MSESNVLTKPPRQFLPSNLHIDSWETIQPYFEDLLHRNITSAEDLKKWLKDKSELESVLEEDLAWRYIKMNINTGDEELRKSFEFFITEISPKTESYNYKFDKKFTESPFTKQLGPEFKIAVKLAEKRIRIFREQNIPLKTEIEKKAQQYGAITGQLTVEINGQEVTMPKANAYLEQPDRSFRKEAYDKISAKRLEASSKLNTLFTELIELRTQVARNADYENYTLYRFDELGRLDYTPEDCYKFHESIKEIIVPINKKIHQRRKEQLKLDTLKPYDTQVDPTGKEPLHPFNEARELINKTIECFNRIDPDFARYIRIMDTMGHLDLESKKGKAPGGFNYPLYETGVPFIYMNAVGTMRDMVTMLHEGGHAIHSFLTRNMEYVEFKSLTSEIAELASMGMELISMEHWEVFFPDKEDLKRAKRQQLETVLSVLPWVAIIDKFQHWIYAHPKHSVEERYTAWINILDEFNTGEIDWSDYPEYRKITWQNQLHLFEVPFYYIEYAIAQLGAIALWKNYKQNPRQTVEQYKNALSLGYTKSIAEVYQAAGIEFNFQYDYIKQLADFVSGELEALY
ncbi:MAG: M3 family oligoendopeptidase [Bacteroidetes bacterium]|nr:MAG: M3 family oligoendopeptidase [Bacteroidota bacterium]